MTSRKRLLKTLELAGDTPPPRFESEFPDDTVAAWRRQGLSESLRPEQVFALDELDTVPVDWRRQGGKSVVEAEADLASFRRGYAADTPGRFPEDWTHRVDSWGGRDYALTAAPWNEGLFQVMGIADAVTFNRAIWVMCEQPRLIEALMQRYADFLEDLVPRVLAEVRIDFALFYEAIASPQAPVIAPADYARFAVPALERVVAVLERHGVAYRVLRSSGEVRPLIPLWLDAGINGLLITQTATPGIRYTDLRRQYGRELRLVGGIPWQAVVEGPPAIDRALSETVKPLLEDGGYIPHLDDTVRPFVPYSNFHYYRRGLDALIADVYGHL